MTPTLTRHASRQAEAKGISPADVLRAARDPQITYASRNREGQERALRRRNEAGTIASAGVRSRRIRDGIVADAARGDRDDVTVYANVVRTR